MVSCVEQLLQNNILKAIALNHFVTIHSLFHIEHFCSAAATTTTTDEDDNDAAAADDDNNTAIFFSW